MRSLPIQSTKLNPNFVGSWIIENPLLCEKLVEYFEGNLYKQKQGMVGSGVNLDKKNSVDITIKPKEIKLPGNEVINAYFETLFDCYKQYVSQWPFLEPIAQKLEIGSFNIQRYRTGQHFKEIHTERFSLASLHRVFAFMTYLNDVEEGGSTYFSHYDLEIQPKKGLTLIWPAEWTHAHKGNELRAGSKYIITGWMNFAK